MKVEVIRNEIIIRELTVNDIPFCNIQGRDTGSIYYNPQRPEHSLRVSVEDPSVVEFLDGVGVPLREHVTADGKIESWSFKVKVYPRIGQNRITGEEEQLPKILIKDPGCDNVRLPYESFNLIDSAVYHNNVIDISIAFHMYEAKPYNRMTAALDELKLVANSYDELISQSAVNEEYRNGYLDD